MSLDLDDNGRRVTVVNPTWLRAPWELPRVPRLPWQTPSTSEGEARDDGIQDFEDLVHDAHPTDDGHWLKMEFHQTGVTPLFLSSDCQEAHLLVPAMRLPSELAEGSVGREFDKRAPFAFLGVRNVAFADGPLLVSWCTNPGCGSRACDVTGRTQFEGNDYNNTPSSSFFNDIEPLCPCAEAATAVMAGPDTFADWLRSYAEERGAPESEDAEEPPQGPCRMS